MFSSVEAEKHSAVKKMAKCIWLLLLFSIVYGNNNTSNNETSTVHEAVESFLVSHRVLAEKHIQRLLPNSMGNCDYDTPKPCWDYTNLAVIQNKKYRGVAQWLSGVNDFTLNTLNMNVVDEETGAMEFEVKLTYADIKLMVSLDTCYPLFGCRTSLKTSGACCGKNKVMKMKISADCNETYPYIRNVNASVSRMDLQPPFTMDYEIFEASGLDFTKVPRTEELSMLRKLEIPLKEGIFSDLNALLHETKKGALLCKQVKTTVAPTPITEIPTEVIPGDWTSNATVEDVLNRWSSANRLWPSISAIVLFILINAFHA